MLNVRCIWVQWPGCMWCGLGCVSRWCRGCLCERGLASRWPTSTTHSHSIIHKHTTHSHKFPSFIAVCTIYLFKAGQLVKINIKVRAQKLKLNIFLPKLNPTNFFACKYKLLQNEGTIINLQTGHICIIFKLLKCFRSWDTCLAKNAWCFNNKSSSIHS